MLQCAHLVIQLNFSSYIATQRFGDASVKTHIGSLSPAYEELPSLRSHRNTHRLATFLILHTSRLGGFHTVC